MCKYNKGDIMNKVEFLVKRYKALSDETRIRIIKLLLEGELCVCQINAGLNMSEPRISRHLKILNNAEIIEYERKGKNIFYRIKNTKDNKNIINEIINMEKCEIFKKDLKNIAKIKVCV